MKLFLSFICAFILFHFSFSNEKDSIKLDAASIKVKGTYGFIIPHRSGMKNLIKGHIPAMIFSYEKRGLNSNKWDEIYNTPTWGISYYFADLMNPKQLGQAHGVYPYFNFNMSRSSRYQLSYKLGVGIGYLTTTFDRINNYKNIIIGSHINVLIATQLEFGLKLTEKIWWNASLNFTHFSNGASKTPNLGINIPSIGTGIRYKLHSKNFYTAAKKTGSQTKELTPRISSSIGMKEIYPILGPKFIVSSLSYELATSVSHISSVGGNLDLFHNPSIPRRIENETENLAKDTDPFRIGIMVNYQLRIINLTALLGTGIYLKNAIESDGIFYNRLGLRYDISDKYTTHVILVSNLEKANFIEFGFGYIIKRDN